MEQYNRIGEKIRQIRELQKLSIEELAERSGNSESQIEQLEAGELVPSLAPLLKIARALGVRLGTFLDDVEVAAPVIVRGGHSENVVRFSGDGHSEASTLEFFSLAAGKQDRHMEPFVIDVHPASTADLPLSSHEGEEFVYVLSGEIELYYGKDTQRLSAGDSAYYDSIVPHHLHAADQEARIVAVVYAPL